VKTINMDVPMSDFIQVGDTWMYNGIYRVAIRGDCNTNDFVVAEISLCRIGKYFHTLIDIECALLEIDGVHPNANLSDVILSSPSKSRGRGRNPNPGAGRPKFGEKMQRITITLPDSYVVRLDAYRPGKKRSASIRELIDVLC
jgi:hypothetical protein